MGGSDANRCNQFTAINFNVEIEILGIDGRPAFRQQQIRQNDSRTLEPVGEVMHFGNKLEAIENIRGRRDDFGEIAESRAKHLPQIALFGFRRHARRWAGALNINDHNRRLHHRGHAEALGHESESAAGRRAHRPHAGVGRADRHIDHTNLILNLTDHDAGLARMRGHPMEHPCRWTHWIRAVELDACRNTAHRERDIS